MDEHRFGCIFCGYKSKCIPAMTMHLLATHYGYDLLLTPGILGRECYDCLWGSVVPMRVEQDGKYLKYVARIGEGGAMLLPY